MSQQAIAVFVFFGISCLFLPAASAQTWQQLQTLGGKENDLLTGIACNEQSNCFASTAFRGQLTIDGQELTSQGGEDFLLLLRGKDNKYHYFVHGGSVQDDEVAAQIATPDGGLICVGTYWSKLILGGEAVLSSRDGAKAIFLARYHPSGKLIWIKNIEGTGLKNAADLVLASDGSFYVGGYFSDSLRIEKKQLFTTAISASFLAKYSARGDVQWIKTLDGKGNTRAVALATLPGGRICMSGSFDEEVYFSDTTFVANTNDLDVFVACWDQNGALQWSRKAGGVYDASPISMAADASGNIFVAGNIVGVLRFGNNINIQSRDGNADVFLAQYTSSGIPKQAKVMGGDLVQQLSKLSLWRNRIYLSGYFQGDLKVDNFSISAGNRFQGYVAALDTNGHGQWLQMLSSSEGIFPYGLAAIGTDSLLVGGAYQGLVKLGNVELPKSTSFNLFFGALLPTLTAVQEKLPTGNRFYVYPNPTDGLIQIESSENLPDFDIRVFDQWGRLMFFQKNTPTILASDWPSGMYWAQITSHNITEWRRVMVVHR